MSEFDVTIRCLPAGPGPELARLLEEELGLSAEEALARSAVLPLTILTRAPLKIAQDAAQRLLRSGAEVSVRPSALLPPLKHPAVKAALEPARSSYALGELAESTPAPAPRPTPSAPPPGSVSALELAASHRVFDEPVEEGARLDVDEVALEQRALRVQSLAPPRELARPPALPRPSMLAHVLARVARRVALAAGVAAVGVMWRPDLAASEGRPGWVQQSARVLAHLTAPIRDLTISGMHRVEISWPAAAGGETAAPSGWCVVLEPPSEAKLQKLRLGHDEIEIPPAVVRQLRDHVEALRIALNGPTLDLVSACFAD